ncbi:MAG: ATP-binding protein [Pyrinomonadaceae bacterium]|nr:ATP-binding protein [Pyrinomonadaceae bacterium]
MSERILATISATDFISRSVELDALRRHASGESKSNGLLLLSAPALGASELLKQTYDRLFHEPGDLIPIYFAVRKSDESAKECAKRFLQTFLAQTAAFRHQDAKLLNGSPNLAELAAPEDFDWVKRLVENCRIDEESGDDRACVRACLSAPQRGAKFFVMIDDLHETAYLTDETDFLEELKEIYSRSDLPFVFAGNRRFLYGAAKEGNAKLNGAEILRLEPLNFTEAGFLAENSARNLDVKINEQTRDLIARKFDGNPTFIKFLIQAASAKRVDLDNFQRVETIYADEIFGGGIGRFYDAVFQEIAPNVETQKSFVELIYQSLTVEKEKISIECWQDSVGLDDEDFYRAMAQLNSAEIVRVTSNRVEAMRDNEVLSDYLTARFRLEIAAENRALVVGEMLARFLKRAPQTMAKFYRQNSAIGLRELLSAFNNQETPTALLDYSIFKEHFKGTETSEILENLKDTTETIRLPQIIYTAHTVAFYPPIEAITEKTRSAVALGFVEAAYTDEDETVWLAAEIDAKLEAARETAEFWCDRLEMVALVCNFKNYKLWLVAPEGFAPEAAEVLRERNAFGSSERQVELLIKFLKAETPVGENPAAHEYEIVVPMGDDTELIAAHAVEEIAKRHSFNSKAINQIKTALVEACINAAEHSLSPDRKIYQKFAFEGDKIVITVSNRGLRIADQQATEINPDEGRRGWGLRLIKTLMDEVKFEQVDDGTRISMTKYLNAK